MFIVNRQGMDDYVRYLYPTDIIEPSGEIVWIGTPHGTTFMRDEDKTAGLWSMSMDVRECLGDMMKRLHEYIKAGLRYPDEYRYGPDRIAPQQTHVEGPPPSNGTRDVYVERSDEKQFRAKVEEQQPKQGHVPQLSQSTMSEIDQLFAKLTVPASDPAPAPAQSLTGLALLDTMFASISDTSLPAPRSVSTPQPQSNGHPGLKTLTLEQLGLAPPPIPQFATEIISPQPSAAGLPQILTADVIHGLMGLGSDSRSTSRLSARTSESAPRSPSSAGARRSRERGYYADRGEDDGSASETSTGLGDGDGESIGEPRITIAQAFLSVANVSSSGTLKGDATPRARPEALGRSSPSPLPDSSARRRSAAGHTVSEAHALSKGTTGGRKDRPGPQAQPLAGIAGRTVSAPSAVHVPFQSGEELWPDASSASNAGSVNGAESTLGEDDVVELDFSEIRVLDDIRTLEIKNTSRGRKAEVSGKQRDRQPREKKSDTNGAGTPGQSTPSHPSKKEKEARGARNGLSLTPSRNGSVSEVSISSAMPPSPSLSHAKEMKHVQPLKPADVLRDVTTGALKGALLESGLLRKEGTPLERNAFIREVLTLIHVSARLVSLCLKVVLTRWLQTDKTFVDRLYQMYIGMIPGSS